MVKATCAEKRALVRFYKIHTNLSYREIATNCGISKSTAHMQSVQQIKNKKRCRQKNAVDHVH